MIKLITNYYGTKLSFELKEFDQLDYIRSFRSNYYIDSNKKEFELFNINYKTILILIKYIKMNQIETLLLHENILHDLNFLGYEELHQKISKLDNKILQEYNILLKNYEIKSNNILLKEQIMNEIKKNPNKLLFSSNYGFLEFLKTGNLEYSTIPMFGFVHKINLVEDQDIQKCILDNCDIHFKDYEELNCLENIMHVKYGNQTNYVTDETIEYIISKYELNEENREYFKDLLLNVHDKFNKPIIPLLKCKFNLIDSQKNKNTALKR